jgi:hypothetical protein
MSDKSGGIANAISGLNDEAKAWALLVASNGEHDKLQNTLVTRMSKLLARRYPTIRLKALQEVVQVCFDEKLTHGQELEQRQVTSAIKSRVREMHNSSSYETKHAYNEIINSVMKAFQRWECQVEEAIRNNMLKSVSFR